MAKHASESENVLSEEKGLALPLIVKTYFSEVVNDNGDIIVAVCSLCKPKIKHIHGQYKATSNFSKHVKISQKPDLGQRWIAAVPGKNFVPSNSAVICSRHFRDEDIGRSSQFSDHIRENAVPPIFPEFLQKVKKARMPPRLHVPPLAIAARECSSVVQPGCDLVSKNPETQQQWIAAECIQNLEPSQSSAAAVQAKVNSKEPEMKIASGLASVIYSDNAVRCPSLSSIEMVINQAKRLGMGKLMAEFFEEQLWRSLRFQDDIKSELTSTESAAVAVKTAQPSVCSVVAPAGPCARILIQQCLSAKLMVRQASETTPDVFVEINRGIIVYVCFLQGATIHSINRLAESVLSIPLSETSDGRLVSILDLPGEVLIIPQSTLGGEIKGKSMQYNRNLSKTVAEVLYNEFVQACKWIMERNCASIESGCGVLSGTFGGHQTLSLETNSPYSHVIEI